MLSLRDRPYSARALLAARKRWDDLAIPPAKRAKTTSSSPPRQIVGSKTKDQVQTRRTKAERWVDQPNNDPIASGRIPLADDGPPFFIRKNSDESDVVAHGYDASMQYQPAQIGPTAPTPSLLAQYNATDVLNYHDHGSDDFRSVIDDLTVQNKKLKRKLQKYEQLHCSHLQKEKLFEVRIHELPAHKKRELEDTLRSFASSIDNGSQPELRRPKLQRSAAMDSSALRKTASSSTSGSRPVDSAYTSMSSMPGTASCDHISKISQNIVKPSLDDIPEILKPNNVLVMSEKTKSKLVVRRLEQIFTGRGGASHRHTQLQHQQEVSAAAAEVERSKIKACGQRVWREGTREAHILPLNAELRVESTEESDSSARRSRDSTHGTKSQSRAAKIGRAGSPEQRPTRPLDLDIHRAEVPSDNIDYIRHLGLASPTNDKTTTADGDDGWVYLNLLTSMAQLHALNVTPSFIRKAIKGLSQKFELSVDGTKVRWLGGTEGGRMSSNGDDNEGQWRSSESSFPISKRDSFDNVSSKDDGNVAQATSGGTADAANTQAKVGRRPIHMEALDASDPFHYRPLFTHLAKSDEDTTGSCLGNDSPCSTNSMEYETGINSSSNTTGERLSRFRGRKHDSGPIIFYQRAKFCTDLGGDTNPPNKDVSYDRFTHHPVGCPPPQLEDTANTGDDHREAGKDTIIFDPFRIAPTRSALDLDDLASCISDCANSCPSDSPLDMEASGLGGIQPSDNFVVKVQTQHRRKSSKLGKHTALTDQPHTRLPKRILHYMPRLSIDTVQQPTFTPPRAKPTSAPSQPIQSNIVSAVKTSMAPSSTPPPSHVILPFTSSESSSSDEGNDSDGTFSFRLPMQLQNRTAFSHHGIGLRGCGDIDAKESSYGSSAEEGDVDDGSSESSIDLLAHARTQDPETVRAQEAEWQAGVKEGSVSVAATGGGNWEEGGSDGELR